MYYKFNLLSRLFSALLLSLVMLATASADVIISEVYYDPVNTETGGEAVELYNTADDDLDISGYFLKTSSSEKDATLPVGSIIKAKGFFLIADAGFSENKDSSYMPDADYEEAITLKNTDGGVAILSPSLQVLDAVGWGNAVNIDPSLYEGTPASLAGEGESLQRKSLQDTGINSQDFSSSQPNFSNSLGIQESGDVLFYVSVNISESLPLMIENITILDEYALTGNIDIYPIPKEKKYFNLSVKVNNNGLSVASASAYFNSRTYNMTYVALNSTHFIYSTTLYLDFYSLAGFYPINISFVDGKSRQVSSSTDINYLELVALELDTSDLHCSFSNSTECTISGDADISTSGRPTIRNIGNTELNTEISGLNFSSTTGSFGVEHLEFTFDDTFSGNGYPVTSQPSHYALSLLPGNYSLQEISFRLNLPDGVSNGEYLGKVSIIGVR